jgi:hypothetical protein
VGESLVGSFRHQYLQFGLIFGGVAVGRRAGWGEAVGGDFAAVVAAMNCCVNFLLDFFDIVLFDWDDLLRFSRFVAAAVLL